jgi:hypothetical protein
VTTTETVAEIGSDGAVVPLAALAAHPENPRPAA